MTFLLVDRITALDPPRQIRGTFTVPRSVAECPTFLLAEAVGQLAAWAAMAELDFRARPVAALAAEVVVSNTVAVSGDTIDLAAHIDGIERGGVLYGGSATTAGRTLLVMNRCVGPLLPMTDFDDPEAVRADFHRLRGATCEPGGFEPIPPPQFEVLSHDDGQRLRVGLQIPCAAEFFNQHFPRKPVYPATILFDRKIQVAQRLLARAGSVWRVRRALHVKISAFTSPGERLEIEAVRVGGSDDEASVQLTGYRDGIRVSRARMELVRQAA